MSAHPADKGITLRSGTLIDATIIDAPSSTRNRTGARDPEMSSIRRGNDWPSGVRRITNRSGGSDFPTDAHVGVDVDSGAVHSLDTSTAKVHDSQVRDELSHGEATSVWADRGYVNAERAAAFTEPGRFRGLMRKAPKGGKPHALDGHVDRIIAVVRAKVVHPFRVIKRQFGNVKTRYRERVRNRAQLFALFALGDLFVVRRKLMV